MTAPALFLPHAELVIRGWLLAIPGVPAAAAELPTDQTTWADRGFITYLGLGGRPIVQSTIRRPTFQLDFWAVNPNSAKQPWGKANQLAEIVRDATEQPGGTQWGIRGVDLGPSYRAARVLSAQAVTEPRRLFDDAGGVARYSMDVTLTYVAAS